MADKTKPVNIVNDDAVALLIAAAMGSVEGRTIRTWFQRRARRLISTSFDVLRVFTPRLAGARQWPHWVYERLDDGETLYWLPEEDPNNPQRVGLEARLQRIGMWIQSLESVALATIAPGDAQAVRKAEDQSVARELLADLPKRRDFEEAEQIAERWFARLRRRIDQRETARDAGPVFRYEDGWRVVRIRTTTGLDRESRQMSNCIGDGAYDDGLDQGFLQVYSLRDPDNAPHVTILTAYGGLAEMKGRQNTVVAHGYRERLLMFLNWLGMPPHARAVDVEQCGFIYRQGRYVDAVREAEPVLSNEHGTVYRIDGDWSIRYELRPRQASDGGRIRHRLSIFAGELHLSDHLPMHAIEALLEAVRRQYQPMPPPGTWTLGELAGFGIHFQDGRYLTKEQALPLFFFADGDRITSLTDPSGGEHFHYIDRQDRHLATFLRPAPHPDAPKRLYVAHIDRHFRGGGRGRNLLALLNDTEAFLGDGGLASQLDLLFFRPWWQYMTREDFHGVANDGLLAIDCALTVSRVGPTTESLTLSIRHLMSLAATVTLDPVGPGSPFHLVTAVTADRPAVHGKAVAQALNALGFQAARRNLGAGFVFHRRLRCFANLHWLRRHKREIDAETRSALTPDLWDSHEEPAAIQLTH